MKFLQAHSLLKGFDSDQKRQLRLVMSGQAENLALFIRAEYALRGIACELLTIPFNTLYQYLLAPQQTEVAECFLLFPWDLLPALDWRSGISPAADEAALAQQLDNISGLLLQRKAHFFYSEAQVLPYYASLAANQRLSKSLLALALRLNAQLLAPQYFSLNTYLNFGAPFASSHCGDVAEQIAAILLPPPDARKKLLVTDLDNVMWAGVIGEDGMEGIRYAPEGLGYPHFIYQTFLRKLKSEGVLLVAVSKNDPDLARLPLRLPGSPLTEEDFVAILASYQEKSGQIAAVATQLNLGLDACVFVDDNPVEIAKVAQQLPEVSCVTFPNRADDLPEFFARLQGFFSNNHVTAEDKNRTRLYLARLAGMVPASSGEVNLESFLRELEMELQIFDRTNSRRERAIQLINKTNQFNLNGIRYTDAAAHQLLMEGGRLFTGQLRDKHGDHGEVIACLLNKDEEMVSLVMSCRVMERKLEQAFLAWLAANILHKPEMRLLFRATERNTPVQQFMINEDFVAPEQVPGFYLRSRQDFIIRQQKVAKIFRIFVDTNGK